MIFFFLGIPLLLFWFGSKDKGIKLDKDDMDKGHAHERSTREIIKLEVGA